MSIIGTPLLNVGASALAPLTDMTASFAGITVFEWTHSVATTQIHLPQQSFSVVPVNTALQKSKQDLQVILPHKKFAVMSSLNNGFARYFKQQGVAPQAIELPVNYGLKMSTVAVTKDDLRALARHKLGKLKFHQFALGLSNYFREQGEEFWAIALEQQMDALKGSRLAWNASLTGIRGMSADEWTSLLPPNPVRGDEVVLTGAAIKPDGKTFGTLKAYSLEASRSKSPVYAKVHLKYNGVIWEVIDYSGCHAVDLIEALLEGGFIKESCSHRFSRVKTMPGLVKFADEFKYVLEPAFSIIFREKTGKSPRRGARAIIGGVRVQRDGSFSGALDFFLEVPTSKRSNGYAEIAVEHNGSFWVPRGVLGARAKQLENALFNLRLIISS